MQSFPQYPADAANDGILLTFSKTAERCRVLEHTLETWREHLIRADHELRQPVTTLGLLNHALQRAPDLETSRSLSLRLGASIESLHSLLDTIALQTRRLRDSAHDNAGPVPLSRQPGDQVAETEPLQHCLVWVIEDHPQVRESLRLLLTACGARVALFEGRPPADFEAQVPDVVLIDQHLAAEPTGLELAAQLRTQFPNARLALLTGDTEQSLLQQAQCADVAVLHKPIRPDQLLQTILGNEKALRAPETLADFSRSAELGQHPDQPRA